MQDINTGVIIEKLQKKLDTKRFVHTISVAATASALAVRYDVDMPRAYLAGLLHDNAKCLSDEKKINLCMKYNIEISDIEHKLPDLLHGKLGSAIANKKYGIEDIDILNAIAFHTTGRMNMSDLEKIIYIADYIEPFRKELSRIGQIRKTAFENQDQALVLIMENTISYLQMNDKIMDPLTLETYEYYKKRI